MINTSATLIITFPKSCKLSQVHQEQDKMDIYMYLITAVHAQ